MTAVTVERPYYRRWPTSERAFELETVAKERYLVTPGAFVRSDLLVGIETLVRDRFEAAIKHSKLPIEDPQSVEGAPVILTSGDGPRLPGRLVEAAMVAEAPAVTVVVVGDGGADVAKKAAETAHVPVIATTTVTTDRDGGLLAGSFGTRYVVVASSAWRPAVGWLAALADGVGAFDTAPTEEIKPSATPILLRVTEEVEPDLKVWIVLTTYGRPDVVVPCLAALRERTGFRRWGLIVIDDASHPSDYEAIRAETHLTRAPLGRFLVQNKENQGYLKTANRGAALAIEQGADAIVFLNSDVFVTPGWLAAMCRAVGATGAALVNPLCNDAGLITLPFAGQTGTPFPRMRGGLSYLDAAGVLGLAPPSYPAAVTSVGNCMLVTREAWLQHGPFDEIYGRGYGEECELWARVLRAGGRAVVADDAFVYHSSHATHGAAASEMERAGVQLFKQRHGALYESMLPEVNAWPKRTAPHRARLQAWKPAGLPVQFVAVDIGPFGGAMVLLRLAHELRELGLAAQVGHLQAKLDGEPCSFSLVRHRDESTLGADFARASSWSEGVAVATHWSTGALVDRICVENPGVMPLAFWQDVEHRFENPKTGRPNLPPGVFAPYVRIPHRIVNSMWVGNEGDREFNLSGKFTWIPVGIDTLLFRPRPEHRRPGPVRVLAMWRPATPRRGHVLLRQIYRELRSRFGNQVSLELYGWPEEPPQDLDRHHGRLPQARLAALMSEIDVVVEPSEWQGFGLAGAEAMASGCALASADTGGVHAYATHGVNALIVPHVDLVEAVAKLVADADLRTRIGAAGPRAIRTIDWRIIGARWALHLTALWRAERGVTDYDRSIDDVRRRAEWTLGRLSPTP